MIEMEHPNHRAIIESTGHERVYRRNAGAGTKCCHIGVPSTQIEHYAAYIGLDVHKDTIAWSVAVDGRAEPMYGGEIANRAGKITKLVERLSTSFDAQVLLWCYEAGPCGYTLHRQLLGLGQDCQVVAPSKIPKQPADRVKTDKRDSIKLARLLRSGDLTAIWIPDDEQESIRDLTRARGDIKAQQTKARQQLAAFLLRRDCRYSGGRSKWTKKSLRKAQGLELAPEGLSMPSRQRRLG